MLIIVGNLCSVVVAVVIACCAAFIYLLISYEFCDNLKLAGALSATDIGALFSAC